MFTHNEALAIRAYHAAKKKKRVRYSWAAPIICLSLFACIELCRGFLTGGWPIVFTERVVASGYGLLLP